jgi:hypothetical protein
MNLRAIRARAEKATAGPWTTKPLPGDTSGDPSSFTYGMSPSVVVAATAASKENRIYANPPGGTFPANDQGFIAHARTDVPEMASWIARAETCLFWLPQLCRCQERGTKQMCSVCEKAKKLLAELGQGEE